jgi:hypothetical protein
MLLDKTSEGLLYSHLSKQLGTFTNINAPTEGGSRGVTSRYDLLVGYDSTRKSVKPHCLRDFFIPAAHYVRRADRHLKYVLSIHLKHLWAKTAQSLSITLMCALASRFCPATCFSWETWSTSKRAKNTMTTLISFSSSSGQQGRCDAKCYDAKESECDCICGGRNHGAGRDKAIENTRVLAEQMIDEYAQVHGIEADTLNASVNETEVYQLVLPIFG